MGSHFLAVHNSLAPMLLWCPPFLFFASFLNSLAKLLGPGGPKALLAQNLLLQHDREFGTYSLKTFVYYENIQT